MNTRALWAVGASLVAVLVVFALVPHGLPLGFVPVVLFGIAGFWMARHHRHLEAKLQAEIDDLLRQL